MRNITISTDLSRLYRAKDGFIGTIIGLYTTREGVEGVVLQQQGTTVVHVYRMTSVEIM